MMHENRFWNAARVDSIDELDEKITGGATWTGCTGWRFGGFLFLNDATSPDGAQEYAVIRESDGVQVESLTCSWMKRGGLAQWFAEYAEKCRKPDADTYGSVDVASRILNHGYGTERGPCSLCA